MKNKIEEIVSDFLWETNNQENRDEIAYRLSEALNFKIKDETNTNEFLSFEGFNPTTDKKTVITIEEIPK